MTDSREKGKRAEYGVRDLLRKYTGKQWERVPGSGAFGEEHSLKGDVYLPSKVTKQDMSRFCIEVKHYAQDSVNSNLVRPAKQTLEKFWEQTLREAEQLSKVPMLVFKKDRGKWLVALDSESDKCEGKRMVYYPSVGVPMFIYDFEDWLKHHAEDTFHV